MCDPFGHLMYGYALGGGENGWYVAEVDTSGDWRPDWLGGREADHFDMDTEIMSRLISVMGRFTEPDPQPDLFQDGIWQKLRGTPAHQAQIKWSERRNAVEKGLGVDLWSVGGGDYREYVLTVAERKDDQDHRPHFPFDVEWSDTRILDFVELEGWRTHFGWDERLTEAVKALGVTPVQLDGYYWQEDCMRTPVKPGWILGTSSSD